jgi:deazaflavin-dependent oxidoreductase (nitroreductase family)
MSTMSTRTYLKPGWFSRTIANPLTLKIGAASELTVRGRKSGNPHSVPVTPIEVDGAFYLVAPRGVTDWVLNLRASGEGELKHKRETWRLTAEEQTGDHRARIVSEYQRQLGKMVANYFRELPDPSDHPTFRLHRLK